MNASKRFKKGICCVLCDQILTEPETCNDNSFTIDHVYPKSHDTEYVRFQAMCRRCNQLKGNNIPTVTLIRILSAVRKIEFLSNERCTRIECIIENPQSLQRVYRLYYKGIGSVEITECTNLACTCKAVGDKYENIVCLERIARSIRTLA